MCGQRFAGAAMTRHVRCCYPKHPPSDKPGRSDVFHIVVKGQGWADYWLHLGVPVDASLEALDGFLRDIWLECCGHMSEFEIRRTRYCSVGPDAFDEDAAREMFEEFGGETMDVVVGDVLEEGSTFKHEYDMGTTTQLSLKVAGCWPAVSPSLASTSGAASSGKGSSRTSSSKASSSGAASSGRQLRIAGRGRRQPRRRLDHDPKSVLLLARNDPPRFECVSCGAEAVQLCPTCSWREPAWYCAKCRRKHNCGMEFMLPVVNSPRMGECAYTGADGD